MIGVFQNDHRVLAAELELHLFQMLAGEFADAAADMARAGERHHRDVRIGAQRLAGFGAAGQNVQHALRQAGFLERAGDDEAAGHDRARIGLEHHRVAGRKRRPNRAHRQDQREVERRDDADDAARHPPRQADAARIGRQHQTLRLGAHRGGAIKPFGHHVDLEAGFGRDAAGLARDPGDQFFLMIFERTRGLAQDGGALLVGRCRPAGLRGARFGRGLAHIGRGGVADAGDLVAGRRLQHVQRTAGGVAPFGAEHAAAPGIFDQKFSCRCVHCRSSLGIGPLPLFRRRRMAAGAS